MNDLKAGDKVTATVYGEKRTGTVTRIGRSIVFVQWDGRTTEAWMHASSLTKVSDTIKWSEVL